MSLLDTILQTQGSSATGALAQRFGLSNEQTMQAVQALMPHLQNGMMDRAQNQPDSLSGLSDLLMNSGAHEEVIDDPHLVQQQDLKPQGDNVLGMLLGSKDESRRVAEQASNQTGIPAETLKKMLPFLAMIAIGALRKQAKGYQPAPQGGGLGGMLGGALGQGGMGGGLMDILGGLLRR